MTSVHYSTPIVDIDEIGNGNHLYMKRDDMIPFSFGGNKARKAEYFFREVDAGDYDCIVTYGSSSSNHCRVVANQAAKRGLPCYIIGPEEASEPTYNHLLMVWFGAETMTVPVNEVHDTIEAKLEALRAEGKHPYFIAGGGHGNLGTRAYIDCYSEIVQYEKETGIHFDKIFFASGTGTTHAGLVCGKFLFPREKDTEIIGISIARKNPRGRQVVLDSIKEYFDSLGVKLGEEEVEQATIFLDRYTGDGYAGSSEAVQEVIYRVMTKYGIPLDHTYTGKAFYGMERYLEEEEVRGENILFIHTGGTPLFFDELFGARMAEEARRGEAEE